MRGEHGEEPGDVGVGDAVAPSLRISTIEQRAASLSDDDTLAIALTDLAVHAATTDDSRFAANLRTIVANLPISIFSLDRRGELTSSYGGALRRMGVADGELVGLSIDLFGEDARAAFDQVMTGRASTFDVGGASPEGDRWAARIVIAPLSDGDGAIAVSFDVTEQVEAIEQAERERRMHHSAVEALRDSEQRFQILAEYAPIGIIITDAEMQPLYVNPAATEILGRGVEDLAGRSWLDFVHDDDREAIHAELRRQADRPDFVAEYRVVRPDDSWRWIRLRSAPVADELGTVAGYVVSAADITDVVVADAALREREERLRAIVETAAEGIVTCDEAGRIVEFNAAAERIFGYDSDEVIGVLEAADLLDIVQRDELVGAFQAYVAGRGEGLAALAPAEINGRRRDGEIVPLELALAQVDTSDGRLFTAVIRDISERKAFEQELEHLATHDSLTGLPNRALLIAQLDSALLRARRHRSPLAVLFVDIDRVKLVTEALGHRAGDDLIVQAARRIEAVVGSSATVSRFSGDQFVVHIEELDDIADAVEVATAIIEVVNDPFFVAGDDAFVAASVGIAYSPVGEGTAESLVSNADVAMNRAKEGSATRYEVFDSEMRAWVDARRKLEVALRHGIDREEFQLHYQPVVDLESGRITGVEALVRWDHPRLGLLPPGEFIPLAEDSGLIIPLGEWIVGEASRQLARWHGPHPDLKVSVNLSARQLALPGFADSVATALHEAGADPGGLTFEITETVLLDDLEAAGRTLDELKALGASIALDDFGTGYSSLTNLVRLPIDVVKIDRSFVDDLDRGGPGTTIVATVVNLAATLELEVVAEGVETEAQRRALVELGCPSAQGFLFSRPTPVDDVDAALAAGGRLVPEGAR
ncbi:MAG: EAL domain-containing protein [Acidimicrobiales bacterium]